MRRNARRLHANLVVLGYDGSYARVAAFVRQWRAGREVAQQTTGRGVFVPLLFQPGEAFQFDWSEDWAMVGSKRVKPPSAGFTQAELHFGFAEKPDVPSALALFQSELGCNPANGSFFIGRETPVPSLHPDSPRWQERIYAFVTRNAVNASDYFLIPAERVVELGTKIEI